MTKQVRTAYRSHRRTAWVVALGLAVAVAAVVVPMALAADKTYTLKATPAATCASPAQTTVTIKNTGSPQTLGSAEIYFPSNTVDSASSGTLLKDSTSSAQPQKRDIIRLDNLNLTPTKSKDVVVTFKSGVTFDTTITAVVKQSNRFNDSSGSANLFRLEGSFPTLKIVTCVTVSGSVYHDRNLDNVFTTGDGAFDDSDVPKAWTVKLYVKSGSAYSLFKSVSPTSATDGSYTFTQVPTGSDYRMCVTALGADATKKWGLQSPTGNTDCGPISTGGPSVAALRLPNLSANATDQDFQVVPVVGPVGKDTPTSNSTVGGYIVDPSSNSTKADDFYVQDVWIDSDGNTNFRFSPINPCTPPNCPPGKIFLLETLVADADIADLEGNQVTLRYDDEAPFFDGDLKPMPYCLIDPTVGQPAGSLATTGVLPTIDGKKATSCIVTGEQSVSAGTGKVHVEYTVYTAYDGGRQIGLG
jgi:hypothetical protein